MKPLTCPNCSATLKERFLKNRAKKAPVAVLQCASCYCVLLDERAQWALGISMSGLDAKMLEPGGRDCPKCEREFNLFEVPDKQSLFGKVEIDRCPACNALFFDPGELQKALGRVTSIAASPDDEYLKSDPQRVSSSMSDERGPWRGDSIGVAFEGHPWLGFLADIDLDVDD